MANWVRFSERIPMGSDLDFQGMVFIQDEDGKLATAWVPDDASWVRDRYKDCCWLENLPPLPKPRTLEDVVKEYLYCAVGGIRRLELKEEMQEILERKDDERF